jgi:hypothetical protein
VLLKLLGIKEVEASYETTELSNDDFD